MEKHQRDNLGQYTITEQAWRSRRFTWITNDLDQFRPNVSRYTTHDVVPSTMLQKSEFSRCFQLYCCIFLLILLTASHTLLLIAVVSQDNLPQLTIFIITITFYSKMIDCYSWFMSTCYHPPGRQLLGTVQPFMFRGGELLEAVSSQGQGREDKSTNCFLYLVFYQTQWRRTAFEQICSWKADRVGGTKSS